MNENSEIFPNISQIAYKCLCPGCPSHNHYMKSNDEQLFCSREKTECDFEKRGCLCGDCHLRGENGIEDFYYCDEGLNCK